MLDQIPLPSTVISNVREQPTNNIELVISRKNLLALFLSAARVCDLDDLSVILNYVCEGKIAQGIPEPPFAIFKPPTRRSRYGGGSNGLRGRCSIYVAASCQAAAVLR